ncbi:photosystem I reaction center subunit XII [Synechocystis sp. FACHB-383]|uniref:photosystem I reaction center subunit XII n=1 Tax=Synechocystis sp. FACHB-383 TaxID=2692864 RepID=UPI00168732D8|nr:photosystem I reaction center subunit XII [Synechocystis sp. FACHB-383]MBD2653130.1 photosystem I reaction center subunit XII [Synechocystis sp. FACHB-383]
MSLTTAQQFELEQMKRAATKLSHAQALELLVQSTRLLMIKNNVYQSLLQQYQSQPAPLPRD